MEYWKRRGTIATSAGASHKSYMAATLVVNEFVAQRSPHTMVVKLIRTKHGTSWVNTRPSTASFALKQLRRRKRMPTIGEEYGCKMLLQQPTTRILRPLRTCWERAQCVRVVCRPPRQKQKCQWLILSNNKMKQFH